MKLIDYVRQVSLEDFGKAFRHTAFWNKRLRTTGGRFFPRDGHLDFNPKHYETYGENVFRQIVRHELCHYHLYFEGKGYRHGDKEFQSLLAQVDGLRYAPQLTGPTVYKIYRCQNCQACFFRKRRMDTAKYRCGSCQGALIFEGVGRRED